MPKKNQTRNKNIKEKKEKKEKSEIKKDNQYFEDIIDIDENISKDFEFLSNAPISENDHFVFQSEKDWTIDISKYSEFFTIDLKTLSAAIEAIPFNNNVNIDTKYFTDDQITDIYNNAERGKEKYNKILSNTEEIVTNIIKDENKNQDSLENTAEELDFLLSCREPINDPLMIVKSLPFSCNTDSKIKTKSNTSTKSLDLEKWLDSILDD